MICCERTCNTGIQFQAAGRTAQRGLGADREVSYVYLSKAQPASGHRDQLRVGVDLYRQCGRYRAGGGGLAAVFRHHLLLRAGRGYEKRPLHLRGGTLGLLAALGLHAGTFGLAPSLGLLGAFSVSIGIVLAVIILGGTVCPVACNNVAFAYLTVATVNFEAITPAVIGYQMAVFWIGGAIILGGSLAAATLGGKLAGPHAAPAHAEAEHD